MGKEEKNNQEKLILIDRHYIEEVECSNCRNNFPILFHDEILHRGPVNRGKSSRVSIEFTFVSRERYIMRAALITGATSGFGPT